MKKIVSLVLFLCFVCQSAFADCDWTQIKKLPDGGYEYTPELHLCVGQLVQDSKTKDAQISDLNRAVQLKDLAITQSDARTQLWMSTSQSMESRLQKVDSMERTNTWVYFGLGVLTTIGAGFLAARMMNH